MLLEEKIQQAIDFKTKPLGALGRLEKIARQICLVQQTLSPKLRRPVLIVFAADHGIAEDGVSAFPQEVTAQMVLNFLCGGAAVNVFCRQNDIELKIVDAGVNYDFGSSANLISAKMGKGTASFLNGNAMTRAALEECFSHAEKIIGPISQYSNVAGFGEMGIGNTSSASLLMSALCRLPIEDCVGKGTGLNEQQLQNKIAVLRQAQQNHPQPADAMQALEFFGGFEIAQMCGAMLSAYSRNMLILIDGFIATAAFLCAFHINKRIKDNAIFCHQSGEQGHQKMLEFLGAEPILDLGMRLGEGTGCAIAYPVIASAVNFINEMASFESAGVSNA
ncbi:MAG TPA: nicotinate-nucleotide--dimethylbenzimidazole phosphoribosyltransferase [Flavobacterium sp.]|nr:nicotinate-nucleotide--dimethylbenzimidazole phosphoribosyltransferase [Flavobacterium sp.]